MSLLKKLFQRPAIKREIDEELRFHIERATAENIATGLSPEDAAREARKRFGNVQAIREQSRGVRGASIGEALLQDIRFGARMLCKNPGFTAVAVLTLALGIGANTAIFSVINAVLLRPLPFREPEHLVWIRNGSAAGLSDGGLSGVTTQVSHYSDWKKLNHSFTDLAAYFAFFDYMGYTLTGQGEPERLHGVGVSQNFLDMLGVQPKLGREFDDEECKWNGPKAALLTDGFWRRRFGADPAVVGRTLSLNNKPCVVAGVLPASFDFSSVFTPGVQVDFLEPFPICSETDGWGNTLAVVGRLKPGATLQQAQAEFNVLTKQLTKTYPKRNSSSAWITPLRTQISGGFRRSFAVLLCAVGCVLLIACANLSNLLLARGAARQKEIAVRMALGASRNRLVLQMLTESLLLSVCGAALSLPLAVLATKALSSLRAFNIPLLQGVSVDATTLGFTLVIATLTGVCVGVVPALQISGGAVFGGLKESGRGSTAGSARTWMREALVISEVAVACVLLIGAGLFLRSFARLIEVDPGFQPARAVAWRIETSRQFSTPAQENAFYHDLVTEIESLPGVESAGLTDTLPLGRNRSWGVGAKGVTYPNGQNPVAFPRIVDAGYLGAMRIPLRAGRGFNDRDTAQTEPSVVINEAMAKLLWPGKAAVGEMAAIGKDARVIGVVGNVRHSSLEDEASPEMYLLGTQAGWGSMDLVVRSRESAESLVPNVRAVLRRIDPNLPTAQFETLGEIVDQAVSPKRFVTFLIAGFSFLALVLASLGIYAVISYSVSQRTHEIGIRMALGAQKGTVLKLIVGEGMRGAVAGIVIGLAAGLALTRLTASLLFGVSATDPLTYASVACLLGGVALAACWLPATRATKVDPMIALRNE